MIKRSFSLILRYASFLSVAIASTMMLVRYHVVHQIYCVQYIFFLLLFSCTIQLARKSSIATDLLLIFAYVLCIIYSVFIFFLVNN